MKNIKKLLITLLIVTCLASSITNSLIVSDTQTNTVCEKTENSNLEIMLCHDNTDGLVGG